MKNLILLALLFVAHLSSAQHSGTASVTQGLANATTGNLYPCANGRIARLGTITADDNTVWTVAAVVCFNNNTFPVASNLHNVCIGANYSNTSEALSALNGSDIINIDATGEVITAFVFADNYFEMYINGVAVGKDNVPFTQFNSNIVRFRVARPFTIAMLLVDWEENLGVGSENNNGFSYHPGDGGMVAVFMDSDNNIIARTGNDWKAQSFYTAPILDLGCPTENGTIRLSNNCSTQDSNNGTSYYGLHWQRPTNWESAAFDDTSWPPATEFSNAAIGVNNKPAYTNFTDVFDDPEDDAIFIWSSNVVLDNEVIVRHRVPGATTTGEIDNNKIRVFPNPFSTQIQLDSSSKSVFFELINTQGITVFSGHQLEDHNFSNLAPGLYYLKIINKTISVQKMIKY